MAVSSTSQEKRAHIAVPLDDGLEHREDIQPDVYRSPEVILDIPWTYSVDIWNVGCMVSNVQVSH